MRFRDFAIGGAVVALALFLGCLICCYNRKCCKDACPPCCPDGKCPAPCCPDGTCPPTTKQLGCKCCQDCWCLACDCKNSGNTFPSMKCSVACPCRPMNRPRGDVQ